MSKVLYRNQLLDGNNLIRAVVVVTGTVPEWDPTIVSYPYVVSYKGTDLAVDNYDTFETYDGALVAALEFVLEQALFYSNLKSEVTYE